MENVCLIDDEPGVVDMCSDFLGTNYQVRSFHSAEEAIQAFDQDYQPSVVITDIKMPGMTGLELAHKLNERHQNVPIIVMSAFADKSHILQAMDEHVFGFVEKPFDPRSLRQKIDDAILNSKNNTGENKEMVDALVELSAKTYRLARICMERYMYAERRLAEEKVNLQRSPRDTKKFLDSVKAQAELELAIEKLSRKISRFTVA